jgi:superfamily II DNA or RNA helicase
MAELGDRFGLLVIDEAHHFGGGRHDEALDLSIAPLRLGLSATPPGPGDAASRLATLVGPTVFELDVAALTGTYLAPFDRITWRIPLEQDERHDYEALVQVYRRVFRSFQGGRLSATWEDFLRHAGRTDEGRTALAAWRRAARLLAYPRGKRAALAQILARHRAHKTLIFVANNETAYAVATEHLIMPLTCDIGRAERQQVMARFGAGELRALVSAQVLNEGLDVPDAEVGVVVAGRRGEREHAQRVGRLLRPGPGKRALVYELVVANSSEARQAARRWERLAG